MKISKSNSASIRSDANRTERATTEALTPSGRGGELTPKEDSLGAPVQTAKPRPISERKLQANRANAQKSTGPRTARGKASSRRNAVKHGLRSHAVLFRPDGTPIDPELQVVWARLREEYGEDDVRTDALVQTVVAEWSHQRTAMELELSCFQKALEDSSSTVSLRNLERYRTTSQRALLKNLGRLHKLGEGQTLRSDQSRKPLWPI